MKCIFPLRINLLYNLSLTFMDFWIPWVIHDFEWNMKRWASVVLINVSKISCMKEWRVVQSSWPINRRGFSNLQRFYLDLQLAHYIFEGLNISFSSAYFSKFWSAFFSFFYFSVPNFRVSLLIPQKQFFIFWMICKCNILRNLENLELGM